MEKLNEHYVNENLAGLPVSVPLLPEKARHLPEKAIQFGEGVFLRAFVEDFINEANARGIFNGTVVIVQPIDKGRVDELNQADRVYTLVLRGLENGEPVEYKKIITSVSRAIKAYDEWDQVLACAEKESISIVISNTTEAGIILDEDDRFDLAPPRSYPGKLTNYLYHRWQHFKGTPQAGMLIIPVELIDKNATTLRQVVLTLCERWELGPEFTTWVKDHTTFCNSLVDRIVTGYPFAEAEAIQQDLGYSDDNLDTAEPFQLWAIEGDSTVQKRFPLNETGLQIVFTDDYTMYRNRKVRILNGSHTSLGPLSYLLGVELVRQAVEHTDLNAFWQAFLFREIIPSLPYPKAEMEEFARQVTERFKNPFIKHEWKKILLNSVSKFKARVVPSIIDYHSKTGELPAGLCFALAAFLRYMQVTQKTETGAFHAVLENGQEYQIEDDQWVCEFFLGIWQDKDLTRKTEVEPAVTAILQNRDLWGQDLAGLDGMTGLLSDTLGAMAGQGIKNTLKNLLRTLY